MIVKMAVKETPALPGKKLKQYYFKVCYSALILLCQYTALNYILFPFFLYDNNFKTMRLIN